MPIAANLARVVATDSSTSILRDFAARNPSVFLGQIALADLQWRKQDWSGALGSAIAALSLRPNDFHALAIVVASYGHLQQYELAYPYAKRLLGVRSPNWAIMKIVCGCLGAANLIRRKKRDSFFRALKRCDLEAQSDRDSLRIARELVSRAEGPNGAIAV
jgi:hypothetical protein